MSNRDRSSARARERLARFAVEFFAQEHMKQRVLVVEFSVDEHTEYRGFQFGPVDENGLEQAAEEVLVAHHRELLTLESPVEPATARRLARDRYQAINALIYIGGTHSRTPYGGLGDKFAKETQLRITDGAPLTICMGDRCRIGRRDLQTVQTVLGEVTFALKGCRAIFPDCVRTDGGKMWPGLCPDYHKPQRTQRRATARRLKRVWEGHDARVYESFVTIPPDQIG